MSFFKFIFQKLHLYYLIGKGSVFRKHKVFYSSSLELKFNLHLDNLVDFLIFHNNVFQPEIVKCINKVIVKKACTTFIDIGSHIGQMSLYVAKHYKDVSIISVEANYDNYTRQQTNMALNNLDYNLINRAVHSKNGLLQFYIDSNRHKSEYFKFNDGKYTALESNAKAAFEVEAITLDLVKEEYKLFDASILIKLDIEGTELEAITGGMEFFTNNNVIVIIELLFSEHQKKCEEVIDFFADLSYSSFNLLLEPIDRALMKNGDFVFMREQ